MIIHLNQIFTHESVINDDTVLNTFLFADE